MTDVRTHRLITRLAVVALLTACAAPAAPSDTGAPPATDTSSSPTVEPSAASPSSEARPACPNPHGGNCLGELEAGTYETTTFIAGLTYTVPAGWGNYEDLPGNFLLVPPDSTLADGDAGTGEYIGVYEGVAVPGGPPKCIETPDPLYDRTVNGIVEGLSAREGLVITGPEPITIGELEGVVLDLSLVEGYTGTCPFAPDSQPVMPILVGTGPAGFHHVLTPHFDMRLYLLPGPPNTPFAIEVIDVPGRQSIEELSAIVEQMSIGH